MPPGSRNTFTEYVSCYCSTPATSQQEDNCAHSSRRSRKWALPCANTDDGLAPKRHARAEKEGALYTSLGNSSDSTSVFLLLLVIWRFGKGTRAGKCTGRTPANRFSTKRVAGKKLSSHLIEMSFNLKQSSHISRKVKWQQENQPNKKQIKWKHSIFTMREFHLFLSNF